MTAYYNENDPYAAQYLRNLISAGVIAPGVVDERDIREVEGFELTGFTQCHFFAGIGIWSGALRAADWPDDEPIWTGSCPCQPFSNAGKQKGFDERHLWPFWRDLVTQCSPSRLVGEQVASKAGRTWLDTVSADMEALGFAFGAADLCAAGFSGAHIRQREYFVGLSDPVLAGWSERWTGTGDRQVARGGGVRMADDDDDDARLERRGRMSECAPEFSSRERSVDGGLADCNGGESGQTGTIQCGREYGQQQENSSIGGLADSERDGQHGSGEARPGRRGESSDSSSRDTVLQRTHAPMLGRTPVDWLYCRDGKWRPVELGTFPLVDADPGRVGKLRAYGNALDFETATEFCRVVKDIAGV